MTIGNLSPKPIKKIVYPFIMTPEVILGPRSMKYFTEINISLKINYFKQTKYNLTFISRLEVTLGLESIK